MNECGEEKETVQIRTVRQRKKNPNLGQSINSFLIWNYDRDRDGFYIETQKFHEWILKCTNNEMDS